MKSAECRSRRIHVSIAVWGRPFRQQIRRAFACLLEPETTVEPPHRGDFQILQAERFSRGLAFIHKMSNELGTVTTALIERQNQDLVQVDCIILSTNPQESNVAAIERNDVGGVRVVVLFVKVALEGFIPAPRLTNILTKRRFTDIVGEGFVGDGSSSCR